MCAQRLTGARLPAVMSATYIKWLSEVGATHSATRLRHINSFIVTPTGHKPISHTITATAPNSAIMARATRGSRMSTGYSRTIPTSEATGMIIALAITALSAPGWFYGLYYPIKHQHAFMLTVDFVFPPIGVVHGWGAILGIW